MCGIHGNSLCIYTGIAIMMYTCIGTMLRGVCGGFIPWADAVLSEIVPSSHYWELGSQIRAARWQKKSTVEWVMHSRESRTPFYPLAQDVGGIATGRGDLESLGAGELAVSARRRRSMGPQKKRVHDGWLDLCGSTSEPCFQATGRSFAAAKGTRIACMPKAVELVVCKRNKPMQSPRFWECSKASLQQGYVALVRLES